MRRYRCMSRVSEDAVLLSPLRAGDKEVLFEWINDSDLVRFSAPFAPVSWDDHSDWFEGIQDRKDHVIFTIRLAPNDKLVGVVQLRNIHPVHRSAELIIRIGSETDRGHGIGRTAIEKCLFHAWNDLNLHRVYLNVFADNVRAVRAYESAGFLREGCMKESAYIDGRFVDVILMATVRNEDRR